MVDSYVGVVHKVLFLFMLFVLGLAFAPRAHADTTATLLPNGEGSYLQWKPKTGSTHYTAVDESTCNGTTDYVAATTTGNRDSFTLNLGSLPNGSQITKVAITPCASRDSGTVGGSATMNVFYRFNGVDSSDAGAYAVTGTTPVGLATTNFSSTSLQKMSTSTLQVGAVYTSGTRGVRLGRVGVVLTYTPPAAPSAPTNLAGTASTSATSGDAVLTWSDNSFDETGFKIERSTDGINFSQISTVGPNITTAQNNNLSNGTYYYRVRANNLTLNSGYSNTATVTIAVTLPNAPTSLSVSTSTVGSTTVANLAWTDNATNENGFSIEQSTDGTNYSIVGSTATDVTTFQSAVTVGTLYYYRVKAYNGGGNSSDSNVVSITP